MSHTRSIAPFALALTIAAGQAAYAAAVSEPAQPVVQTDDQGVAIHGYDPVAYFTEGRPVAGSAEHRTSWHGATYQFASEANRVAFQEDPERYAPQYGGYCAWGLAAQDQLFDIDPAAWRIVDDKLYLNYNAEVQKTWLNGIAGFIRAADQNWQKLKASHKE